MTGNLYRPASVRPGERLPAVFYVCGHSNQGRPGNKTAYQSHGIWFAKHGYVCLVVDSLQLGEIAAIHHGTYREGRWWWHSRGYTPAGVECWNGIRGIDYLISRADVDPQRIAVTGISGGGAATFWIAAADQRVKAAVPVSGMADLHSYVTDRVINGHCDCMFLYNTFQWPWTRIAALIAPRPLLFANSDQDAIFPMDANDRVINRLKRVYSLYGASDMVDAAVSVGGHAYRKDLRQAAYRFINMHLKDDPRIVADSEEDLVAVQGEEKRYPIEPEKLRVFPKDSDLPKDELNTTIDRYFVPMAQVLPPRQGEFDAWRITAAGRVAPRDFPRPARQGAAGETHRAGPAGRRAAGERAGDRSGIERVAAMKSAKEMKRVLLVVRNPESKPARWPSGCGASRRTATRCTSAPRGAWTARAGRGRTRPITWSDRTRCWGGRSMRAEFGTWQPRPDTCTASTTARCRSTWLGEGPAGVLAAYAALWEPEIAGVILNKPPLSHMEADAPALLNVLRVCDIPDVLGMLAPRPVVVYAAPSPSLDKTAAIYQAAGAAGKFSRKSEKTE